MQENSTSQPNGKREQASDESKSTLTQGIETVAKTIGKVAGLAARTMGGESRPVEMLREDHTKVKQLFELFEQAQDDQAKSEIVTTALRDLEVHATLEEELFYPAVRALDQHKKHQDAMDEALEEHHVVKLLISELGDMSPGDDRYDAKFKVLAESVRHHILEEESEMFPKAERGDLDREGLAQQMAERKQELIAEEDAGAGKPKRRKSARGQTRGKKQGHKRADAERGPAGETGSHS